MDIKKIFKTDPIAEKEGVWVDIDDSSSILIARVGNPRFKSMLERLTLPYKSAIRKGTLSQDVFDKILAKCTAETIVLDWRGFEEDGNSIPYSPEKAYEYLTEYPDFRDFVESCSESMELFRCKEDAETEKN